ncbi:MAG: hypothetical protein CL946_02830, partial [Ectothiorhodospiraceae bacterium]|nr:hypothetical protein [Ectothiorhodospiraceae bacterium]
SDLSAEVDGFRFTGRLDRIERRNGRLTILDYKTGRLKRISYRKLIPEDRSTWQGAIGSLQLPYYIYLYSHATGADPAEIDAGYLHLGSTGMSPECEVLFDREHDGEDMYPAFERIIRTLVAEITDPAVPFSPAEDLASACEYCEFATLCGTRWLQ